MTQLLLLLSVRIDIDLKYIEPDQYAFLGADADTSLRE